MAIPLSSSDFNEIEFPEYNPTPYKGGYDIGQTYGDPLPPSDAICYPRSQISGDPDQIVPVSAAPAAADDDKYEKRFQDGIDDKEGEEEEEEEQRPIYEGGGNWSSAGVPVRCCDLGWGNIFSYDDHRFYGDGYGHEYGYCKGTEPVESEMCGDSDRDYRGSGSESYLHDGVPADPQLGIMSYMDAFEDLCYGGFVQQGRDCSNDQIGQNPWKETADYLFGNSNSLEGTHYYDPSCYDQYSDLFQHDSSSWNHQSNHYTFQSRSHHYEAYPHKTDSAAEIGSALYLRQYKH